MGWKQKRTAPRIACDPEKGRTHQSFRADCDINVIVSRFLQGQDITHVVKATPRYGDYSNVASYQEAMNMLKTAEKAFMGLPAEVRSSFENDPQQLLDLVDAADSGDELAQTMGHELGLWDQKPPEKPEVTPPIPEVTNPEIPQGGE